MKTPTILFPTDFSEKGNEALSFAESIARERGAKLLIAHVHETPFVYGDGNFLYGVPEPESPDVERQLRQVKPHDASIAFEHRLVHGVPAEAIVDLANDEAVDLIVMSSHGRSGILRAVMGSVAEVVLRHARCPVLIFKPRTSRTEPTATAKAI